MYNFDPPSYPLLPTSVDNAPFPLTVTPQHRDDTAPEAHFLALWLPDGRGKI